MCYLLHTDQHVLNWFASWFTDNLKNTRVYKPNYEDAKSRVYLARSILTIENGLTSVSSPVGVLVVLELRPSTPTLTQGLAKFLHPARVCHLAVSILKENVNSYHPFTIWTCQPKAAGPSLPLWYDVPDHPILKIHHHLRSSELVLQTQDALSVTTVIAAAHLVDRPMREAVY